MSRVSTKRFSERLLTVNFDLSLSRGHNTTCKCVRLLLVKCIYCLVCTSLQIDQDRHLNKRRDERQFSLVKLLLNREVLSLKKGTDKTQVSSLRTTMNSDGLNYIVRHSFCVNQEWTSLESKSTPYLLSLFIRCSTRL